MANSDDIKPGSQDVDSDLAKDVAHLYSWARVEDVAYHDFSRQRRQVTPGAKTPPQTIESASFSPASIENMALSTEVSDSATALSALQVDSPPIPPPSLVAPATVEVSSLRNAPPVVEVPRSMEREPSEPKSGRSTTLAIYSLAGGVGKTTLCANLGRIFCALKEKVLLVDASGSGLLPFYFGASDLRAGLRTFVSPEPYYPPLQVLGADEVTKDWLEKDVVSAMHRSQRTIFDLSATTMGLLPEIFKLCGVVLVPLLSDLNSILTVSRIEASFAAMKKAGGNVPDVFYVFNEFDANDAVDQQARTLVERQCGERLLPITIRHGDEIPDAISERMTVADHAPASGVTQDYLRLARWVRERMPVSEEEKKVSLRWSEQ